MSIVVARSFAPLPDTYSRNLSPYLTRHRRSKITPFRAQSPNRCTSSYGVVFLYRLHAGSRHAVSLSRTLFSTIAGGNLFPERQENEECGTDRKGYSCYLCALRGQDLRRILETEIGVLRSLQAVNDLLHCLGIRAAVASRSLSQGAPPEQEEFKKTPRTDRLIRRPS